MIYDKIENIEKYENVHPRFKKAFAYFQQLIAENITDGRYEMPNCDVDGAVFANVSSYSTRIYSDADQMEAHHKYIDVQMMLAGEEVIYVPSSDQLIFTQAYDETGDYELMKASEEIDNVGLVMKPNTFAIFFTNEPHMPGIAHGKVCNVHKMIGKVLD